MPSPHPRVITVLSAVAALGVATLGATAGPPIDEAVATTVTLPACNPSLEVPPTTANSSSYTFANATGGVEVEPARRKNVAAYACLNGTAEPAKARYVITAIKAPKSARYITAVTETTTVFRDGTTRKSAASFAVPATEQQFNRLLRRISSRVELSVPGIGSKVYVSRRDVLTTIAKRQNGRRVTADQRAAAAKAVLAALPEPAPEK